MYLHTLVEFDTRVMKDCFDIDIFIDILKFMSIYDVITRLMVLNKQIRLDI